MPKLNVVPKAPAKPKKIKFKVVKKLPAKIAKEVEKSAKEIAQARGYYKIGDDRGWFQPHPASIGNLKGERRKKAEKALAKKIKGGRALGDMSITIK